MGYEKGTYPVSKSENFVSLFKLASGFTELGDHSREFDSHDGLGSLWGKRIFAFSLHDIHPV